MSQTHDELKAILRQDMVPQVREAHVVEKLLAIGERPTEALVHRIEGLLLDGCAEKAARMVEGGCNAFVVDWPNVSIQYKAAEAAPTLPTSIELRLAPDDIDRLGVVIERAIVANRPGDVEVLRDDGGNVIGTRRRPAADPATIARQARVEQSLRGAR